MIEYSDFEKVDIRVGRIVEVSDFPEARKPAYKLVIDFGENIGLKKSSAQLPSNYTKDELKGKKIIAVVNFAPRQIGPFISEVLTLGVPGDNGECVLVLPDDPAVVGERLY